MNPRCVVRLARSQTDPAPGAGPHEAGNDSEHGATRSLVPSYIERACREQQQVGGPGDLRFS
jgi:hypothetical protein